MISIAMGIGYMILMLMAFSLNPEKKYYHQLFKLPVYLFHIALAAIPASYGVTRLKHDDFGAEGYLLPLLFLIVFRLADLVVVMSQGRHILVVTRGDDKPASYKWWVDGILSVLSVIVPFLLALLISTFLQQRPGFLIPVEKDLNMINAK
jgi:hypothetical protein